MSDARITHKDLTRALERIAEMRDDSATQAAREKYEEMRDFREGRVQGFALALDAIHQWSNGAYGQPYAQQITQTTTPGQGEEASS